MKLKNTYTEIYANCNAVNVNDISTFSIIIALLPVEKKLILKVL